MSDVCSVELMLGDIFNEGYDIILAPFPVEHQDPYPGSFAETVFEKYPDVRMRHAGICGLYDAGGIKNLYGRYRMATIKYPRKANLAMMFIQENVDVNAATGKKSIRWRNAEEAFRSLALAIESFSKDREEGDAGVIRVAAPLSIGYSAEDITWPELVRKYAHLFGNCNITFCRPPASSQQI